MKFINDRQRKAVFWSMRNSSSSMMDLHSIAAANKFSDMFGNASTPSVSELMAGRSGAYPEIPQSTEFSFGSDFMNDAGVMGDELDEYSKKALPHPGLHPRNKCQDVLTTHMDKESYDIDAIPKEMFDTLGMTKEEVKDLYDKHGIRLIEKNDRFSVVPGDRVLSLGNKDIDYGTNFGMVREVKDKSVLIRFDESGKEIWYPEDMVFTQRMLDDDIKKKSV